METLEGKIVSGRKYRASLTLNSFFSIRWEAGHCARSRLPRYTYVVPCSKENEKKYVYSQSGNFLRRRSHAKDGAKVIDQATRLGLTLPALNQQLPFLFENDRAVGTFEKSKGIRSSTKGDPRMTKMAPREDLFSRNSSESVPVPSIIPANDLAVTLIGLQRFFSKKQKSGPKAGKPTVDKSSSFGDDA
ncbi:hypothetical protein V1478_006720 [Vespula squamosa]|uniref:Uncharacterized protein n=1 Tax=Vespula squamosa TaxID=30214 RepID=A0ABD2B175_VESSQ